MPVRAYRYPLAVSVIVVLGVIGCDTGPLEVDPDSEPPIEIPPEPFCQADQLTDPAMAIEPDRLCGHWTYLLHYNEFVPDDTVRFELQHHDIAAAGGAAYSRIDYLNGVEQVRSAAFLYANRADGLYMVGYITPTDSLFFESLLFPYPASVGELGALVRVGRDRVSGQLVFTDTIAVEVMATDAMVETPADTFSAYHYRFYDPPPPDVGVGNHVDTYLAPGIGRIAEVVWRAGSSDQTLRQLRLSEYELADAP